MSILIRGMEMPTSCVNCRFSGFGGMRNERVVCMHTGSNAYLNEVQYLEDCPLVPVPNHGRLIDADALKKKHHWTDDLYETEYVEVEDIDDAPTIIPAEEGE